MNPIEELKTSNDTNKVLPKLGMTLFLVIIIYQIYRYYEIINARYNNENIIALNVTASDTPEYTPWRKYVTGRYSIKAKEFNCHFWAINGELGLLENNEIKRHQVESIKRGDILKLNIYESDKIHLNGLYSEIELVGLSVNNKIIYTVNDVKTYDKEKQESGLITASFFVFLILGGLIWRRIKKSEE